jgi:Xaa-Pro aminopeptidase
MPAEQFAARRHRLLQKIRKTEADALLVTSETNVTYLTGFSGDSSYLLLSNSDAILISDSRYTIQIQEECPGLDTFIRKTEQKIIEAVEQVTKQLRLKKLGFESGSMTYQQWKQYSETIKHLQLVPVDGLVETLREVKDAEEIKEIRVAIDQAQRGFELLRSSLRPEMTERESAHDLEHAMRRFGAEKAGFDPIVAVGARAALPHARPGSDRISDAGFVLIDWGANSFGGYKSDLTRILVTGNIFPKLRKIYRVVLNAQQRAIEAIRPGVLCKDVDSVARNIITKAGYGKNFGHGLGHGIGLDIHEGPRLSPTSDNKLKAGMVVTVEPGIYLPGKGGVRIEDDVLVTRTGHEVLTSVPKEFDEMIL